MTKTETPVTCMGEGATHSLACDCREQYFWNLTCAVNNAIDWLALISSNENNSSIVMTKLGARAVELELRGALGKK